MIDLTQKTPFYIKDVVILPNGEKTTENMYEVNEVIDGVCKGIVITDEESLKGRWYSINTFDSLYADSFITDTMFIDYEESSEDEYQEMLNRIKNHLEL